MGSYLSPEAMNIFKQLGVEHFIVAYDWDDAGRKGIEQVASGVGGTVHYLGGMKPGQDPYEMLKDVTGSISGFSLRHLMTSAKMHQPDTDKPIHLSFISCGPAGQRNVIFSPAEKASDARLFDAEDPTEYHYNVDDFMPLLSYDHGNKAMLDQTMGEITKLLEARHTKPQSDRAVHDPGEVPANGSIHRPGASPDPLVASGHRAADQETKSPGDRHRAGRLVGDDQEDGPRV